MAAESVSFRITRTTEDLAQTVSALSQRLVKLEQRLDRVASLLADCRTLLDEDAQAA
jgi:flagellar capping protein FliD